MLHGMKQVNSYALKSSKKYFIMISFLLHIHTSLIFDKVFDNITIISCAHKICSLHGMCCAHKIIYCANETIMACCGNERKLCICDSTVKPWYL